MTLQRNQQTNFSKVAHFQVPRSKFNRLSETILTMNQGDLVPFYNDVDILPADTHSLTTSWVVRTVAPLKKPITGNLKLDYWFFYVPYTQLWNIEHCKNFFGESTDAAWVTTTQYTVPKLKFKHDMFGSNDATDANGNIAMKTDTTGTTALSKKDFVTKLSNSIERYLFFPTLPTSVSSNNMYTIGYKDANNKYCAFAEDIEVNAWANRAYHRCYNFFFRREDLIAPVTLDTSDSTVTYNGINDFTPCYKVSKYRDFYVSSLPYPEKAIHGENVTLPLGTSAPVKGNGKGLLLTDGTYAGYLSQSAVADRGTYFGGTSTVKNIGDSAGSPVTAAADKVLGVSATDSGLYTDLTNATAATVNSLRMAIATQRMYEKWALFGSRLEETISGMFHVHCPELTLQIPEYLGGYSVNINISEITNVSADVGAVGAKSITTHVKHDTTKSFTQWGVILGLCAIRQQNRIYANGIEAGYFRTRVFDFYWPSFAHIGEQPTMNAQIFAFNRAKETFGYHEPWVEYKYKPSRIAGQILDYADFSTYVMVDNYADCPYLGQDWIEEDNSELRYAMGLTDDNPINDFIVDVAVLDTAVRAMPIKSVPGLMDHF